MIKKLTAKYQSKKQSNSQNKPKYKIQDLYIGKIVHCLSNESIGMFTVHQQFNIIKENAIFLHKFWMISNFIHLKTNQELTVIMKNVGQDYIVQPKEFKKVMKAFMHKHNLTEKSKLSYNQILQLEDDLNNNKLNLDTDEVVK